MAKTTREELLDKLAACKCECHVEAERVFGKITNTTLPKLEFPRAI
jgi:hypothetical protein